MKKKKLLLLILGLLFIIAGCKPAPVKTSQKIPEATKIAPIPTIAPTATLKPTATFTPAPNLYLVTYGYCRTDHALSGDPTRLKDCVLKVKKQMELVPGQTIRYSTLQAHTFASFCAIHQTDGKFITAFVDSQKFGEALCVLPQG